MFRCRLVGTQSLIFTSTERPFLRLVTTALDPSGIPLAAAVILREEKISPLAVFFPFSPGPYHDARALIVMCLTDLETSE